MELTDKQMEKIKEGGWIHASILVEVQGNNKEYVKKALEQLVERFGKEKGIDLYSKKYAEIKELQEKLYSINVELRFLARDFNVLAKIALLYSPSAAEIFEPKEITIPVGDAQNIIIDIANIVTSLAHTVFIQHGTLKKHGLVPEQTGQNIAEPQKQEKEEKTSEKPENPEKTAQ